MASQRGRFEFDGYREPDSKKHKEVASTYSGDFDPYINAEVPIFKPEQGEYTLRLMPPTWDKADYYAFKLHIHFDIGGGQYLCPRLHEIGDKKCPVCEAGEEFGNSDDDKEDKRAFRATLRWGVYVVDRENEAEGPQFWAMPGKMQRELAQRQQKKGGGTLSLADPEDAYDFSFKRTGQGLRTEYGRVDIEREPTPLTENEKKGQKWLDFVVDNPIPKQLIYYDYEHLKTALEGGVGRKDRDDKKDGGRGRRGKDDEGAGRSRDRDRDDDKDKDKDKDKDDDRGSRRSRGRDDDKDGDKDKDEGRSRSSRRAPPSEDEPEVVRRGSKGGDESEPVRRRNADGSTKDKDGDKDKDDDRSSRRRGRDDDGDKDKDGDKDEGRGRRSARDRISEDDDKDKDDDRGSRRRGRDDDGDKDKDEDQGSRRRGRDDEKEDPKDDDRSSRRRGRDDDGDKDKDKDVDKDDDRASRRSRDRDGDKDEDSGRGRRGSDDDKGRGRGSDDDDDRGGRRSRR